MRTTKSALDTSDELKVYRFGNGIKLNNSYASGRYTGHTVASLMHMPFSVYFDDTNGVIQKLNTHNAELCGFDSETHAIGNSYFDRFNTSTAHTLIDNDRKALHSKSICIYDEEMIYQDQMHCHALSIKMPWYDANNNIVGLFGCTIKTTENLATALTLIANIGLLDGRNTSPTRLSPQQTMCAQYLLAGMTVKQIALQMQLSPRTVETYINALKAKLHCKNKAELLIKLIAFSH